MMNLQTKVAEFNSSRGISFDKKVRTLDLASEVGEVCKLAFTESVEKQVSLAQWQGELGDTLYSLLSLMSEAGIDADFALTETLKKYSDRLKERATMSSGR